MISALEGGDLFIGHNNLANICKIFKHIFLKQYLNTIYVPFPVPSKTLNVLILIL